VLRIELHSSASLACLRWGNSLEKDHKKRCISWIFSSAHVPYSKEKYSGKIRPNSMETDLRPCVLHAVHCALSRLCPRVSDSKSKRLGAMCISLYTANQPPIFGHSNSRRITPSCMQSSAAAHIKDSVMVEPYSLDLPFLYLLTYAPCSLIFSYSLFV
jgi:hypothetical protein